MDPADLREGLAEKLRGTEHLDAETLNAACFILSLALENLTLSVPVAAPLARRLLRVAGRVIIDTGKPASSPETWSNTEEMALQWIDEALRALGYEVTPVPDGGRRELIRPDDVWT